jgi:cyclic di-GMP phosphodiesterase Gmr
VAGRLADCVGPHHVVSRFGGDEFVVLLIDVTSSAEAAVRAFMLEELRRPIEQAGDVALDVSMGAASTDTERNPERLVQSADLAMYQVKASRQRERLRAQDNPSR